MVRYSGLQREVLKLYRACLRAARTKPESTRLNFRDAARREFHKNKMIDKKDFGAVESLIRMGARKLELYSQQGVKDIH